MALLGGRPVGILATGLAVPDNLVTNVDLEKIVDTTDEWITERSGIKSRYIAPKDIYVSELAANAAKKAMVAAKIAPEQLGLVLVGTNTPDNIFPATASKVQHLIGARNAGAADVQSGCSGALYAMALGSSFVASCAADYVLIVGAEIMSRAVDWQNRSTCVLFGDGAGAAVLGPSVDEGRKILSVSLKADGGKSDLIIIPAGGTSLPASHETVANRQHYIHMNGREVFKFATKEMPPFLENFCAQSGVAPSEVDWWIFHQANVRIIDAILRRFGVPPEKTVINLDRYGNTSAASVMIALSEAVNGIDDKNNKNGEAKIKPGQKVVLATFGAGMTYGALMYTA